MNRIIKITLFLIIFISILSCASKPEEQEHFSSENENAKRILTHYLVPDFGIFMVIDEEGNILPNEMSEDEKSFIQIDERTDEIPIRDDLFFGVRLDLSSAPSQDFSVTLKTEFPEPGLYDTETGEYVTEVVNNDVKLDNYNYFSWRSVEDGRYKGLALGKWYFKFYYKDELFYVKSFHLYVEENL